MNHTTNPTAVIYDALEGLQGTTHHLPPGTRQAVAEHLARVLPAVSSSAVVSADRATLLRDAADAIDAETRQLKADGVLEPDKFRPCRDASEQLRRLADEAQQPTDQDVVEAHRLALSFALDLGTGAPWDAIQERAEHLSRVAAEEQPAETQAQREPDPDCERCDGSGLDPDAYFVDRERQIWTHAPCSECLPEDDTPEPVKRVKHSGPDTKFCVLCLSGEHERVDYAERPAVGEQPDTQTPCGPAPDACDAEAGEPCANHERRAAHAEGEHCFCGPECTAP